MSSAGARTGRRTPAARSPASSRIPADAGRQIRRRQEALDERGTDDDAVGEAGHLGRLGTVPHAEAHRDGQFRACPDPAHQPAAASPTWSLAPVMPISDAA